jgi:glycosyltransferase involved in cell wall biosynthesis
MISKFRGDTLIWTCHNFHSHERRNIKIETFVMNFLAHRSDAIIVHTMIGKQYIMERFGRTDAVYIIPHGNYIGFHGARLTSPDPELVQELGLQPDDKIFISLGNIRPYKGLERLLGVFRNMPNNYKCIIAGKGFPTEYVTKLQQLSPQNIIWRLGRVDHEDIPRYFSLARAAVFTFEDVLSSGSVILALSYGLPAIVPPVGDLTQIIQQQVNGYFFNSDDELGVIIKKVATLTTAEVQHQKEQSLASVTHLHYEELARQTLKIYNIQHG